MLLALLAKHVFLNAKKTLLLHYTQYTTLPMQAPKITEMYVHRYIAQTEFQIILAL